MKKMFTKLFGTALLTGLLMMGVSVNAQTTYASTASLNDAGTTSTTTITTKKAATADEKTKEAAKPADIDTAWHPQRRLWGYAFGDAYFDQHSPALAVTPLGGTLGANTLGKENNYYETPTNRNAFQFRRLYLGYDYEINKKFKAEVLLASEPNENTTPISSTVGVQNGDNLADGRMSFYIKNFNLRARDVWNGTDFVVGEMGTPGFALNEPGTNGPTSLSETTWGYRSIERTITDFHKNNSYDVGVALQGTFDPATKNFGYVAMIGDNTTSALTTVYNPNNAISLTNPAPNTGFFKIFYGDLWGKFLDKHLYIDFYADYAKTQSTIADAATTSGYLGPQEHNMEKVFVSYTMPMFTFGVEAYTQKLGNALVNNTTKLAEDGTVNAISIWVRGTISKDKWSYFARFDDYNPDKNFTGADNYTVNSNGYSSYDPTVKEQFFTAGFDYTPAKNIHFMPNVWLTRYQDQYDATTKGWLASDHTLVYRMTFFYTFGK
jgi:hypothetical protein